MCILVHWKVEHQYGISQNTSGLNSLTAVALEDLIKPYYKVSLVINMNNIEVIIGLQELIKPHYKVSLIVHMDNIEIINGIIMRANRTFLQGGAL